jgi:hypothetical protein
MRYCRPIRRSIALALFAIFTSACNHATSDRGDSSAAPHDLSITCGDGDLSLAPWPVYDFGTADGNETSCAISVAGTWLDFIDGIVTAMRAGGNANSQALTPPSTADRDAFAARVVAILAGDEGAACALPPSYRLVHVDGMRAVAEVDAAGAPSPSTFFGTYAAPLAAPSRALIIEAPHPIFDADTEHQAADLFAQSGARRFLLAGAHRCADTQASGCDGTTTACGGTTAPYKLSDAAHATQLPFWAVHAQMSAADASVIFIQLHGNSDACPSALVSDSSGSWSDTDPAGKLAAALIARSVGVGKCGAGYPTSTCTLCGTDNVEARYTAGAANSCTMMGSAYGRFVHIEQQPALRKSYQPLIDAVNATF